MGSVSSVTGNVSGDLSGKVIGGGPGTITGAGVWALANATLSIPTAVVADATSSDFTTGQLHPARRYTRATSHRAQAGLAIVGSNMGSVTSVSGSVGSVVAGVTVTTNNDKTGYSLSVAPPTASAHCDSSLAGRHGRRLHSSKQHRQGAVRDGGPGAATGLSIVAAP